MEAMKSLPACPRLSDLAATAKPESLRDWLNLICLLEYFPVFQQNGFDSMERLHMLWEVELTSVSYRLKLCCELSTWSRHRVGSCAHFSYEDSWDQVKCKKQEEECWFAAERTTVEQQHNSGKTVVKEKYASEARINAQIPLFYWDYDCG